MTGSRNRRCTRLQPGIAKLGVDLAETDRVPWGSPPPPTPSEPLDGPSLVIRDDHVTARDTVELAKSAHPGGRWQMAEESQRDDEVETAIGEWQRLGVALNEPRRLRRRQVGQPFSRSCEHLVGNVDPSDRISLDGEGSSQWTRSDRDVEDLRRRERLQTDGSRRRSVIVLADRRTDPCDSRTARRRTPRRRQRLGSALSPDRS